MFDDGYMSPSSIAALSQATVIARLRDQVAALEARGHSPVYPVPPVLAALLPDGGLKPGAAYGVGSAALLGSLLAGPSQDGLWCGLVGLADFGAEAAQLAGVKLERLALIPRPGAQWLSVVATLSSALPVVAVQPPTPVQPSAAARLAARFRDNDAVLLVLGDWPGIEARIELTEPCWTGLGPGWGYLSTRTARLQVSSKRYPRTKAVPVNFPGVDGSLTEKADEKISRPQLRMVA